MVYQVGGKNQFKGFLTSNWLTPVNNRFFAYQFTALVNSIQKYTTTQIRTPAKKIIN